MRDSRRRYDEYHDHQSANNRWGIQNRGFVSMDEGRRRRMAQQGGERTRGEYGPEFYRETGRHGGESSCEEYGPDFYRELGCRGDATARDGYDKVLPTPA